MYVLHFCIVNPGVHSLSHTTRVCEIHNLFGQQKDALLEKYAARVHQNKMIGAQAKATKIAKARKVFQGPNCQLDAAVKKYTELLQKLPKKSSEM